MLSITVGKDRDMVGETLGLLDQQLVLLRKMTVLVNQLQRQGIHNGWCSFKTARRIEARGLISKAVSTLDLILALFTVKTKARAGNQTSL